MIENPLQIIIDEMIDLCFQIDDFTPENIAEKYASFMTLREVALKMSNKKDDFVDCMNRSLETKKDKIFKLMTGSKYA